MTAKCASHADEQPVGLQQKRRLLTTPKKVGFDVPSRHGACWMSKPNRSSRDRAWSGLGVGLCRFELGLLRLDPGLVWFVVGWFGLDLAIYLLKFDLGWVGGGLIRVRLGFSRRGVGWLGFGLVLVSRESALNCFWFVSVGSALARVGFGLGRR